MNFPDAQKLLSFTADPNFSCSQTVKELIIQIHVESVRDLLLVIRIAEQKLPLERLLSTEDRKVSISSMYFEHAVLLGERPAYYWELTLKLSYREGEAYFPDSVLHEITPDQSTPTGLHMKAVLSALYIETDDIEPALGQEFGMNYTRPTVIEFECA